MYSTLIVEFTIKPSLKVVYLQNNWPDYSRAKQPIQLKTKKTANNTNFKPDKYFNPNLIFKTSFFENYNQFYFVKK
jgi:hypothetical protein